ncbi:response regulator [Citricoccus nitrophenolicus]|uniref:Transcriptional regulatory protein n=1 Tax=Citricoccus nitrophenolicus TaxID=863575 RepID=A0ABV0IF33_9MICC|nr:response regulator [Citricoccus sp. I39-566]WMY76856.1 response regulator [Citricoccus sp. I39-566]
MTLIRTLVVDDEPDVVAVNVGFLGTHRSFDVVGTAHTGTTALAQITALRPEMVLLDIHLPDLSGIEVLRAARNLPGTPVDIIAITAAREIETVRAAMAGGVHDYLVKPFSGRVLRERLDAYVEYRARVADHSVTQAGLDQAGIDRLLAPREPSRQPVTVADPLPKGLSRLTLESVVGALQSSPEPASASGIADRLGLSRVSARRYLEFLVGRGLARITPRYGTAGRPEKFYRWGPG